MKKIIFVRHGKAENLVAEISDFERSLTTKGKTVSSKTASLFREKDSVPDKLITSPAFRALETAIIFAEELNVNMKEIVLDDNLYFRMSFKYLQEMLSESFENCNTVMLFGHNPSFTDIPNRLSSEGCDFMSKSGIIGISFDVEKWSDISYNKGKTEYNIQP